MKHRKPAQPFVIDEGPYHRILRDMETRDYAVYVPRNVYIGSCDSMFAAERRAEAARYNLLQDGLIGDAALHMDAAAERNAP